MKTITKVYQVYTIDELSKEAQEKAHSNWRENNEYYFLEECMLEHLRDILPKYDLTEWSKSAGVQYSLSYCQGDGAMFTGTFDYMHNGTKYTITVKQSGHYYHYNSKNFTIHYENGEEPEDSKLYEEIEKAFNEDYVAIAKDLERYGYRFIEAEDSFESFKDACEANEYTFTETGTLDNN